MESICPVDEVHAGEHALQVERRFQWFIPIWVDEVHAGEHALQVIRGFQFNCYRFKLMRCMLRNMLCKAEPS